MTMAIINLLLNFLVVGLLVATISYCWVLNRRIKILQDGKSELATLLKHFDEATNRASESIVVLQTASKKIGDNIQARIEKANYVMEDLAFMVEKGDVLVNKLDANFAVSRARSKIYSEENSSEYLSEYNTTEKNIEPVIEKKWENDHIPSVPVLEKISNKEKTSSSLEAVLDRVVGRGKAANQNGNVAVGNSTTRPKPASKARSKAEQELLDMIRAGIKG